jgi:hypothetical protein
MGSAARGLLVAAAMLASLRSRAFAQDPAFECPAAIDFGRAAVGGYTLRAIHCTNTRAFPIFFDYGGTSGFEDFEDNPCVGGGCYDTFPMVVPPGGQFGITVAFHPVATGPRTGSTILTNDAGLPNNVVTFTGTGVEIGTGEGVAVPLLDDVGRLILGASLALAAVAVLHRGRRGA